MSLELEIVSLLHEKIGFNPESVGSDKILAAVRASLCDREIANPREFLEGLRGGNADFTSIVNAVIVPETWFFRDKEPFELLRKKIAPDWFGKPAHEILRCLSLPCSTGEEPYSIAMSLLDAGLTASQFSIDAVDISTQSLQRAKEGVFGAYSFRGLEGTFRERYFDKVDGNFRLHSHVRDSVRFVHGNVLDPAFMNDGRHYDVVFCRNLLIYFDAQGWKQAISTLERLLRETGVLFMGHAEMLEMTAPQFESLRVPCAFAYRKKLRKKSERLARTTALVIPPKPKPSNTERTPEPAPRNRITPVPVRPTKLDKVPDEPVKTVLQHASDLADMRKFAEAEIECERHLATNPGSAGAYLLMGLIKQAEGKAREAEGHYGRALYLDSKNHEAMVHLALLLEGRGDKNGGASLRLRAERARSNP